VGAVDVVEADAEAEADPAADAAAGTAATAEGGGTNSFHPQMNRR
jgi:hypothetical protein